MIARMDILDIDFADGFRGEDTLRTLFANDIFQKCEKLNIPITEELVEEVLTIFVTKFVDEDSNVDGYEVGNDEVNAGIISTIAHYLQKEHSNEIQYASLETAYA